MQNLLNDLKLLLEKDQRLIGNEGTLLKNKVIELALSLDHNLIRLLLSNESLRKHFFTEVDQVLVFDKIKFQQFVSNKAFLPDSYTAYKNKIGLTANGQYLTDNKEVVLSWAYKDCILEGGQTKEDAEREEVFWNETLAPDQIDRLLSPKVLTHFKKFDKDGEHKLTQINRDENLIIKGNNLLALHTLKKQYAEKVKLIYIDPPFNTGKDEFKYNDRFNHSTWLTFFLNRVKCAKSLLSSDGFFCLNIGNEELAYAKIILDEIFGRENFLNQISMTTNEASGFKATSSKIFSTSNYLLFYRNNENGAIKKIYTKKNYDQAYKYVFLNKESPYSEWKYISIKEAVANELGISVKQLGLNYNSNELSEMLAEYADKHKNLVFRTAAISGGALKKRRETIIKSKNEKRIVFRHPKEDIESFYILNGEQIVFWSNNYRLIEGELVPASSLTDVWTDIKWTGIANEGDVVLKNGKKPESLLKRIIEITTNENELVLDFFSGSGTAGAVAHKMNRRYILIEQMDYIHDLPEHRLKKVIQGEQGGISKIVNWQGGGSFIYCELKEANQLFIDHIQEAKTNKELMTIWASMQETAFLSYRINPKAIDLQDSDFKKLSLDQQKQFLIETLDKNMLYVPLSEIDDETYSISQEDKKLNREFQGKA